MIDFDERLKVKPASWANDRVHFFKYMNESTAKIVIKNQTLRWSTKSQLNDPFEMEFDLSIRGKKELIRDQALEKLWELYSGAEQIKAATEVGVMLEYIRRNIPGMGKDKIFERFGPAIDEGLSIIEADAEKNTMLLTPLFAQIKILSLTVRPDIGLMWSHYANAHRGVVLRLQSIPNLDSPYGMAKPVVYSERPPEFFTESYLVNALCGVETINTMRITDSIIYRKSLDWQYEQEWRISTGNGRDSDQPVQDSNFGASELDGIIFGLNTSDADKLEIRGLSAYYPNIEFMQASRIRGSDLINIEPIS